MDVDYIFGGVCVFDVVLLGIGVLDFLEFGGCLNLIVGL